MSVQSSKGSAKPRVTVMDTAAPAGPSMGARFAGAAQKGKRAGRIAAIIIVLVLAGVAARIVIKSIADAHAKSVADQKQATTSAENKAFAKGDYDAAISAAQNGPDSNSKQSQLMIAAAYVNKKDYQSALAIYSKYDQKNQLNEAELDTAGEVAALAKDPATARHYYQEAIAAAQAGKAAEPNWQANVDMYNAQIKALPAQ